MRKIGLSVFWSLGIALLLLGSSGGTLRGQSPRQRLLHIQKKLEAFSFDEVILLPLLSCDLDEWEKSVHPLAFEKPVDSLWPSVFQRLNQEKERLDQQLLNIDLLLLQEARRRYANKEYQRSEALLERALAYHALSEQVLLFRTDCLQEQKGLDTAFLYFQGFAPHLRQRAGVRKKSQALYDRQMTQLDQLCHEQKYAQGLESWRSLQNFALHCPLSERRARDEENVLERLHKGQYNSLLRVALKAQKNGNIKLSEYYRQKAQEYQSENRAYLPPIATSQELSGKGVETWLLASAPLPKSREVLLPEGSCSDSLITEAKTSAPPVASPKRHRKIRSTGQQEAFDHQLEQARLWAWKNRYDSALACIEQARKIDSLYLVRSDEALDSLHHRLAKSHITRLLSQGQYCIWSNQWERADSLWQLAEQWIGALDLRHDPIVELESSVYQKTLYNKRCQKSVAENRFRLVEARNRILSGQYLQASKLLWEILEEARKSECAFAVGEIDALLEQIEPAVDYQKTVDQALTALEKGDFEQFFVDYKKAEVFYQQNNLDTFVLRKVSLFDKLRFEKNPGYCLRALDYFEREHLSEDFLEAQQILLSWGYSLRQQKLMRKKLTSTHPHP